MLLVDLYFGLSISGGFDSFLFGFYFQFWVEFEFSFFWGGDHSYWWSLFRTRRVLWSI